MAKRTKKRKRIEFSKIIVIWVLVITTLTVAGSYVLSIFHRDTVEGLAGILVSSCAVCLVSYAIKSLGEKHSRNKYHLDADGNPISKEESGVG